MARRQSTGSSGRRAAPPAPVSEEIGRRRELYRPDEAEEPTPAPRQRDPYEGKIERLRMPPQAVDAEQAVLGALMLKPEVWPAVKARLEAADFYRHDHQLIFRAVEHCAEKDIAFDPVTLGDWFESQGLQEQVANGAYLIELSSNTPSAANCEAYAEIVAAHAQLRRLIDAGTHIVNDGFEPAGRSVDEIMSNAVIAVESCARKREVSGVTMKAGLNSLYEDMMRRYEDEHAVIGVPTPYPALSELIDLFEPECYYGVAGRTKMGKSIMLNDIITCAALGGKSVGYWSIEMGQLETYRRELSSCSGVEFQKIKKPRLLDESEWALLHAAIAQLKDARVTTFFDPVVTIERIAAQAAMLHAKGMCDIVVIDYLQLVAGSGKERRDLDIGHNSIGCKNLAKRLKIPVVAAMQFGRGNEKMSANVRPPRASDLRESGNLEQDLDVLIGLHRPGYYDKKTPGCRAEVILNRNGKTGVFRLNEDFSRSRFLPTNIPWDDEGQPAGAQYTVFDAS